jgi:capsule polysaccharide export protein KpsE/RkpR
MAQAVQALETRLAEQAAQLKEAQAATAAATEQARTLSAARAALLREQEQVRASVSFSLSSQAAIHW